MPYVVSDPSITPGGVGKTYGYNNDYNFGGDTVWGNQWKQAVQRGDLAFAQKLETIMRSQKNAPGMQNATNAWWNNRLNTGSVPTNTQPLNLGQIAVTSKSDQGYQNINLGQTPNVSPTGITYSGGPSANAGSNPNTQWFTNMMKNQGSYSTPPTTNNNNPGGYVTGGPAPVSNGAPKTIADIDWSSQQSGNNTGGTVPNRQWDWNSGTYLSTGY